MNLKGKIMGHELINRAYIRCIGHDRVKKGNIHASDLEIELDSKFAYDTKRKDIFWIREDSQPSDYPWFPKIKEEDINLLADGWYSVVQKRFLPGGELELIAVEIHKTEGVRKIYNFKEQFSDMEH